MQTPSMDHPANLTLQSHRFITHIVVFLLSGGLAFCQFITILHWIYGTRGHVQVADSVCVCVCVCYKATKPDCVHFLCIVLS